MTHTSIEKFSIEQVTLTITDLNRSVDFYVNTLGFTLIEQTEKEASLGTPDGTVFLKLHQNQQAIAPQKRSTGLYHFAILVPEKKDLAAFLEHIIKKGYPLVGAADHDFSEAIYLQDPDDIGIEVYVDRSKTAWHYQADGQIYATTEPLGVEDLLAEEHDMWQGFSNETVIGHLHFHVADIARARAFYVDLLGLDPMITMGNQVLFVSGEGYHHHIGLNTWNGQGVPTPDKETTGLRKATIKVAKADYQRLEQQGLVQNGRLVDPFRIEYKVLT